jgi:hypothetical protein
VLLVGIVEFGFAAVLRSLRLSPRGGDGGADIASDRPRFQEGVSP